MKVGAGQLASLTGGHAENLRRAAVQLRAMAAEGVTLAVLPEMFSSGYDLATDVDGLAEPTLGPTVRTLIGLADELDLVIVTAVLVRLPDGTLRDRAVVVDRTGILGSADKRFLWGAEAQRIEPGTAAGLVVPTPLGTVGVAICYEAGFPEVIRDMAVRGADIVAVPAAFGRQRMHAWELMTRSRALENGCFVVASGLTGSNPHGVEFAGHSRIVDPRGSVLTSLGLEEGYVVHDIDLRDISIARREIPYLASLERDRLRSTQLTPLSTEGPRPSNREGTIHV